MSHSEQTAPSPVSLDGADLGTLITSGMRVLVGSGAGAPLSLIRAICEIGPTVNNVELCQLLTLGDAPYVASAFRGHLRHNAFFIGPNTRSAVQEGYADFTPVFLSKIPELLRTRMPVDVALVQVSPPDRHGQCSLGVSVDIVRAAVDSARVVVAEVNPRMPRTHGASFVHTSRLTKMVAVDHPIPELVPDPLTPVYRAIGHHVAGLVRDGDTLQMGIGAIPNAVLEALSSHRDLGIHTEMFSDGVVNLVRAGVITNAKKTLHPGKLVTSFVMGTKKVYDFVDDNPSIEMQPSDYVNDPFIIAQNHGMVAVNSALSVDLTGQVCADSMGHRFYSGVGGQVDFIRGAAHAHSGRPIIALPATAKGGTVSRITPELLPGSGVTTTRNDVHFVVTEFGVAELFGHTIRERVHALVRIAHPQFQDELLAEAKKRSWI